MSQREISQYMAVRLYFHITVWRSRINPVQTTLMISGKQRQLHDSLTRDSQVDKLFDL